MYVSGVREALNPNEEACEMKFSVLGFARHFLCISIPWRNGDIGLGFGFMGARAETESFRSRRNGRLDDELQRMLTYPVVQRHSNGK
jgi:hypothetical protein